MKASQCLLHLNMEFYIMTTKRMPTLPYLKIFPQTMNSFKAQDACFPTLTDFDHEKMGEDRTIQSKGIRSNIYPYFLISTHPNEDMYETTTYLT